MMPTKTQLQHRNRSLRALRGGHFFQTTGVLRKKKGKKVYHCCLGVISEVCGVPFTLNKMLGDRFDFEFGAVHDFTEIPNDYAAELFGITLEQADLMTSRAIDMNDNEGRDFKYIAQKMSKFFKMCDAWNAYHKITV
jgi:hypothetical protein